MHDSTSWLLLSHSSHINKAPTPMILPPVYHLNSSMTFQYHQHLKSGHHLLFLYQLSRSSPWLQTCSHQQAIKILVQTLPVFHYFLRFYLFIFRKRGRREKERERNINVWLPLSCPLLGTWPAPQACALTGNWTGDPLVPSPAFNPLSYTSLGHFHTLFKELRYNFDFFCFPKSSYIPYCLKSHTAWQQVMKFQFLSINLYTFYYTRHSRVTSTHDCVFDECYSTADSHWIICTSSNPVSYWK